MKKIRATQQTIVFALFVVMATGLALFLPGFAQVDKVREMLAKYKNLWADLAFRSDQAPSGKLDAAWRKLFLDYPERFMVGTDTYTPERWHYVVEHAAYSRKWLAELPPDLADNIAFRNAERLAARTMGQ